jgi:hypothetical protein
VKCTQRPRRQKGRGPYYRDRYIARLGLLALPPFFHFLPSLHRAHVATCNVISSPKTVAKERVNLRVLQCQSDEGEWGVRTVMLAGRHTVLQPLAGGQVSFFTVLSSYTVIMDRANIKRDLKKNFPSSGLTLCGTPLPVVLYKWKQQAIERDQA